MPKPRSPHAMAYVTAPDLRTARRIGRTIVRKRLAACANLWPIESMYWWKDKLDDAREVVIVFKTRAALVRRLIEAVRALHPYEIPCIVSYRMGDALPAYTNWIDRETVQR